MAPEYNAAGASSPARPRSPARGVVPRASRNGSSTMPKGSTESSPSPPGLPTAQPPPCPATPILNGNGNSNGVGSVSLKNQMLVRTAQSNPSVGPPGTGTNQLHRDIISRMVTVSGTGTPVVPIRAASMQNFRRSTDTLKTVPESLRQPRLQQLNQSSALNGQARSPWAAGHRSMPSDNPLLKIVEQRMAAGSSCTPPAAGSTKEHPPLPTTAPLPVTSDNNAAALRASINKWARLNEGVQEKKQILETNSGRNRPTNVPSSQSSSHGSPSGRVPLSPKQIELLHELTASQWKAAGVGKNLNIHTQQLDGEGFNLISGSQQAPLPAAGYARPGLTRCAVSTAEVDRLLKETKSIQHLRHMAIRDQMMKEQAYMRQRNLTALASLQASTQQTPNQIQASALNQMKNTSATKMNFGLASNKSSSSLRKRGSEDSSCSQDTFGSRANSIASSMSSHKIHRTLSRSSARCLTGSTDNLRKLSQMNMGSSMRNESFPSRLSVTSRSNGNLSGLMNNRSDPSSSSPHLPSTASQTSLRRRTSSNNWIQSLLLEQNSVGGAAATIQAVNSRNGLASLSQVQSPSANEPEGVTATKPIQDKSEEHALPAVESFQNAIADTKPLDLVKEALSSRGFKCDTKPAMEVEDGFFTKVTKMYDQEIVNAVRSNDIETLRRLHSEGTNLECGNRFGETLIHLACRRSHRDLVSFLIDEARVSLHVRDDVGRTPWHDACWRPEPDLDLLDLLLDRAPELAMLSDKRGHAPLDYARREHWAVLGDWVRSKDAGKFRPAASHELP